MAEPAEIPVSIPVDKLMLAIAGLELVHVPPPMISDKTDEEPEHILVMPEMAAGTVLTVTIVVADLLPSV